MLNTFNLYDIATLIGTTRDKVHFWSSGGTALATDYYLYRPTGKIYYGYAGTMPSAPTTSWSVFYPQQESVCAILKRLAAEAGYTLVTGSFEDGGTVTTVTNALWYQKTGTYYTWGGTLPKVVPAGSTPSTTGGIGVGAWSDKTDLTLRDELAAQAGAGLIGFEQSGSGSVHRTSQDKMRERVTPKDFNAAGDGISLDADAFALLEADFSGMDIDLCGHTYLVTVIPTANRYYNGKFKIGANVYEANRVLAKDNNGVIALGLEAAHSIPANYVPEPTPWTYTTAAIALGAGALSQATKARQTIAIGPDAMSNTLISFDNTAIGEVALQNVQSNSDLYSAADHTGTRNVAIGGNAGQFIRDGHHNVLLGRNNGTCAVSVANVVSVGSNALFGMGVNGWYPYIENFAPNNNSNTEIAVVGASVGSQFTGTTLTALGFKAGNKLKTGDSNVLVGNNAARELESDIGIGGKVLSNYPSDPYVTYVKTGSNIVVTAPGHAAVVGGKANIYWAAGGPAYANHGHAFPVDVIAVSGNTFTVSCPYIGDGSGNARLYWTTSTVDATKSRHNVVIGNSAAMSTTTATNSVFVGSLAAQFVPTSTTTIGIGYGALQNNTSPNINAVVAIGTNALKDNTANCGSVTAVGHNAGLLMQDGSVPTVPVAGSTMLGSNSRVSGAHQVQLGASGTTTYVYGTVQNRSDARDKTDYDDTVLGIDFIMGLRPVDGRWDMRDDYIEEYQVQVGTDENAEPVFETRVRHLPKDGSRARHRKHHWFIAQEVKELCDKLGVEFGGYQDHSVNGGCDVLTLGYDEFIPPTVKAVQQCWTRLGELEDRIAKLELK